MHYCRVLLFLVTLVVLGCGASGPRPHPGDHVTVELFARRLEIPAKGNLTVRFQVTPPGSTEPVPILADQVVARASPQLTLRFLEQERPLERVLVLPLLREC